MPLKLNVGVTKKIGLPHYSSLGAGCDVELELDSRLLFEDLDAFHQKVREAYVACAQAVNDELHRQRHAESAELNDGPLPEHMPASGDGPASGNGDASGNTGASQRPPAPRRSGNGRPASERQLDFIHELVDEIEGLQPDELEEFAEQTTGKPLADLSSSDASELIDRLKAIKAERADPWDGLRV